MAITKSNSEIVIRYTLSSPHIPVHQHPCDKVLQNIRYYYKIYHWDEIMEW